MSYICCCANTRDETATAVIRRANVETPTPTVTESHEETTSAATESNREESPLLIPRSPVTTHTPIIVREMLSEMLRIPSDEVYL